jgi:2,5-diamino-6-(ribosylamino)-4(3H)-pyrimidinone 5'-phosphate reductase
MAPTEPATTADGGAPGGSEQPAQPGRTRPLLAITDSRGRVRHWVALSQAGYWRGMVALTSRATPVEYLEYLRERQVEIVVAGEVRVELGEALSVLNTRFGVQVVRVDSGGTLNGALLRAGLVDEVSVLVSPHLVGGLSPRSIFRAPDLESAGDVIPLKLAHLERLDGGVVWLRYEVSR